MKSSWILILAYLALFIPASLVSLAVVFYVIPTNLTLFADPKIIATTLAVPFLVALIVLVYLVHRLKRPKVVLLGSLIGFLIGVYLVYYSYSITVQQLEEKITKITQSLRLPPQQAEEIKRRELESMKTTAVAAAIVLGSIFGGLGLLAADYFAETFKKEKSS